MPDTPIQFAPCSHPSHPSKDTEYRRLFADPLVKRGGTITYAGYLRAIQLYGREDQLINSHKVHRYERWAAQNPELRKEFQQRARRDGYNPLFGHSDAFNGIHYPKPALNTPIYSTPRDTEASSDNQAEDMPQSTPRDSSGRFRTRQTRQTRPEAFAYHSRNVTAKSGDKGQNAIGAAENALILADMMRRLLSEGINPENKKTAEEILSHVGDIDGLVTMVQTVRDEQAAIPSHSPVGSVLGVLGSNSLDDSPIKLSWSGKKRRVSSPVVVDDDDGEDIAALFDDPSDSQQHDTGLTIEPRLWPDTPFIVQDVMELGEGKQDVFALIAADEAMLFLSERVAKTFGILLVYIRGKTSTHLPLSSVARMAGIDKSLVLSLDMTLYLPNLLSTAAMSYINAVADMPAFTEASKARELAAKTATFMKSQKFRLSASLKTNHTRTLDTEAENFLPVTIVADKLTHLGKAWKPTRFNGEKEIPQTICAKKSRRLEWAKFEEIGQPPAEAAEVAEG